MKTTPELFAACVKPEAFNKLSRLELLDMGYNLRNVKPKKKITEFTNYLLLCINDEEYKKKLKEMSSEENKEYLKGLNAEQRKVHELKLI